MPEYSGYVDPATVGTNPTLDWGTVINSVRDTLVKQEADRSATRQKSEEDTRKTLSDLDKINTGQSQSGNAYITNASYQGKDVLNNLYKQYTSGLISAQQFNIAKQNVSSTFSDVNEVMKTSQADFAKYQDLSQKGELSGYANYMQGLKGDMMDLSNKTMYFDPISGNGYVATIGKDGKPDKNTITPTTSLKSNENFFDPRVKTEEEVGKYTEKMKEFTEMLKSVSHPGVWTINDVQNRPEFAKLSTDITNAVASTPLRMGSILTDFVKEKSYSYTRDPKEAAANPEKILLTLNSQNQLIPQFTKAQMKDGEDAIKRVIISQLGVKEEQVEETYRAPVRAAPAPGKPAPPVTLTTDVKLSSSLKDPNTGKFLPYQRFNMTVPVIDKSTGTEKTIKSVTIDPLTKNMDMIIETSSIENGIRKTATTTISTKKGGISPTGKSEEDEGFPKLDITQMNNMVRFIKNPKTGKYLTNWTELYNAKQPEAKRQYEVNKGGKPSGSYTSAGGVEYTVD